MLNPKFYCEEKNTSVEIPGKLNSVKFAGGRERGAVEEPLQNTKFSRSKVISSQRLFKFISRRRVLKQLRIH